jgi:hypothetical protein
VNTASELSYDHERRLRNQRAFPLYFVTCSCEGGCPVCAYTCLVSRAERKQSEYVAVPSSPPLRHARR